MPRRSPRERKTEELTFQEGRERIRLWLARRLGAALDTPVEDLERQHMAVHGSTNPKRTDLECAALSVDLELKTAIEGEEGAPQVGHLADEIGEVRIALEQFYDRRVLKAAQKSGSKQKGQPRMTDLHRAWTIYQQAWVKEGEEVWAPRVVKLSRRVKRREPPRVPAIPRMFRRLIAALRYLEAEVRASHFSPALYGLRPTRRRDITKITVEKMLIDVDQITYADAAEILYGDRTKGEMIRDHCRRTEGLPQGWGGMG